MKVARKAGVLLTVILLSVPVAARAQNLYRVQIKGSCSSVDATGHQITQPLNNKILVREWAGRVGASNVNDLQLAFQPNAGLGGHAIDLVNKSDGTVLITVFPLTFLESAATPGGKTARRFAYVFDLNHSDFSVGTALMTERISLARNGNTNRFVLDGDMQWYWLPTQTNAFRICSGKFHVDSKPLRFPAH
jgi:hypothetical protein